MRLDRHVGIESRDRVGGAGDLGAPDVVGAVEHLTLQVRQRYRIVVDDAYRADAGRREILDARAAEPASADHQHARTEQRPLSGATDLLQHDVASVTFELGVAQRHR